MHSAHSNINTAPWCHLSKLSPEEAHVPGGGFACVPGPQSPLPSMQRTACFPVCAVRDTLLIPVWTRCPWASPDINSICITQDTKPYKFLTLHAGPFRLKILENIRIGRNGRKGEGWKGSGSPAFSVGTAPLHQQGAVTAPLGQGLAPFAVNQTQQQSTQEKFARSKRSTCKRHDKNVWIPKHQCLLF